MKRRDSSGTSTTAIGPTTSTTSTPADDPDRPTISRQLQQHHPGTDSTTMTASTQTGTLRRMIRTAESGFFPQLPPTRPRLPTIRTVLH
jgi:hypothetical protein